MSSFVEKPRYACALGGALSTLRAINRSIPIIHAASGCGYNLYNATNAGSGYLGGGYCGATSLPSTNVSEKEIVFGGEKRLTEQIENTIKLIDGDLYVVLTGCMVEMIGDDIDAVVRDFTDEQFPVIGVSTPSFKGNSYYGYDLLLEGIAKDYVVLKNEKIDKKVNIIGIVPGEDVFWKGNLKEIKRVLNGIGIEVNTLFGEGETLEDIKYSSDASLTIILSEVYGKITAEAYQNIHGIPYLISQLPIGYLQTEKFLQKIASYFNISEQVVDTFLSKERDSYYDYLERFSDIYADADLQRYVVTVGDANYAPSLSRFVSDELGWLPELAVITDLLQDSDMARLKKQFEGYESGIKPVVKFDTNASSVKKYISEVAKTNYNQRYYDSMGPLVVIGSVFEKEIAASLNAAFLTISFPVTNRIVLNRAYVGINGGLTLMEDLLSSLVTGR